MYLYGESIKVIEHDMIGFRQQGGITLREREGGRERIVSYDKDTR